MEASPELEREPGRLEDASRGGDAWLSPPSLVRAEHRLGDARPASKSLLRRSRCTPGAAQETGGSLATHPAIIADTLSTGSVRSVRFVLSALYSRTRNSCGGRAAGRKRSSRTSSERTPSRCCAGSVASVNYVTDSVDLFGRVTERHHSDPAQGPSEQVSEVRAVARDEHVAAIMNSGREYRGVIGRKVLLGSPGDDGRWRLGAHLELRDHDSEALQRSGVP